MICIRAAVSVHHECALPFASPLDVSWRRHPHHPTCCPTIHARCGLLTNSRSVMQVWRCLTVHLSPDPRPHVGPALFTAQWSLTVRAALAAANLSCAQPSYAPDVFVCVVVHGGRCA